MSKYVQDNEWGTLYPNFRKSEFKCKCGKCNGYGKGIATTLVQTLQELRNKHKKPINITSGYRCEKHNKEVGGSTGSKHMQGLAADFYMEGFNTQSNRVNVVNELKKTKYYRYSYCNVNNNHPNMGNAVHLDTKLVDPDVENKKELIKELQTVLNKQYNCKLDVDGSFGPKTTDACTKNQLYKGKKASIHVKWLQNKLIALGYSVGKSGADGSFGNDTLNAVKQFQKDNKLKVDGYVGADTSKKLIS